MYVYIGTLILLFLLAVINLKIISASIKMKISITIIFLVMALKAPLFGDYSRYADNFLRSHYYSIKQMAAVKGEIGFHALTKVITYITDNPSIYLAITSAIICIFLGIYINRYSLSKIYAVYFYYTIGLFAFSMAGLRQVLAMSICLFAYDAIRKKKPLLFLIIIGVAFQFHKTAIFFLPAYFIARFRWKWNHVVAAFAAFGIIIIFYQKLYTHIAVWLGYENFIISSSGNGEIFTLILLFIGALAINYKDKLLQADSSNIMFLNLHFALIMMWFLRFFIGVVERPSIFYMYSTIILLDRILSLEFEDASMDRTHRFILISALMLFGVLFIYRLIRDINLLPYVLI